MTLSCARVLALCLLLGAFGCKSNGVEAASSVSGGEISGPPTFNEMYQVRNPRVCGKVTRVPDAATAAALVQCNTESDSTGGSTPMITVTTGVQVEVGSGRKYIPGMDDFTAIDPLAKVYPIRGQGTMWQCFAASDRPAGQNCMNYPAEPTGQGLCFKTTFGDYKCAMTLGGSKQVQNLKGPTTY